jgi:gluconokinase
METTPAEVWRAWLWSVAGRIAEAASAVEQEYGRAEEIVASGGALHASEAFRRIVERALGRPVTLRDDGDDTARGAALVALERINA